MTQTVPDISPLMPMHQDPLLVQRRLEDGHQPKMASIRQVKVRIHTWCYKHRTQQSMNSSNNCQVTNMKIWGLFNSSTPGENGRHFADDIFKCIFFDEKFCILIRISRKFVPQGPIDIKWALVQVMAWRRIGDKQLPEPMLIQFTDVYMRHQGEMC